MIVAVAYRFHDNEDETFLVDTDLLDVGHPFEAAVKQGLEGRRSSVTLDGEAFNDDWGNLDKAKVQPPATVQAVKRLRVFWDC